MSLFELMKGGVAIFAFLMASTQIHQGFLLRKRKLPGMWIHLLIGISGMYWGWYYTRLLFDFPAFNSHQVYIRGPLMITFALIAAAGAYAVRRLK
jgi:hypothetical protein